MKIRLKLAYRDSREESLIVDWAGKNPKEFPHLTKYKDCYWSFVFYDNGFVSVDYEFHLAETSPLALPRDQFGNTLPASDLSLMFNLNQSVAPCECGARYTEFPNVHMHYCPQWRKS